MEFFNGPIVGKARWCYPNVCAAELVFLCWLHDIAGFDHLTMLLSAQLDDCNAQTAVLVTLGVDDAGLSIHGLTGFTA